MHRPGISQAMQAALDRKRQGAPVPQPSQLKAYDTSLLLGYTVKTLYPNIVVPD